MKCYGFLKTTFHISTKFLSQFLQNLEKLAFLEIYYKCFMQLVPKFDLTFKFVTKFKHSKTFVRCINFLRISVAISKF